jgi:hypothetical protein
MADLDNILIFVKVAQFLPLRLQVFLEALTAWQSPPWIKE